MNTKLMTISMFTIFALSACELNIQATTTKGQATDRLSCLSDDSCSATLVWDENPAEEKVDYYTVDYAPESTGSEIVPDSSFSVNVGKNASATLLNLGDYNYVVNVTAHRGSASMASEKIVIGPDDFN